MIPKTKIAFDRISINLLKAAVFLMPLFFIPWSAGGVGMDGFGKVLFLLLIVPAAVFSFLYAGFRRGEYRYRASGIDVLVILFLLICVCAVYSGVDRYASMVGFYEKTGDPLVLTVLLAVFFFFIINAVQKVSDANEIAKWSLYGYFAVVFTSVLLVFLYWLNLIPEKSFLFSFMRMAFGYMEDIAAYLAVMNVFFFGLIAGKSDLAAKKRFKAAFYLSFILLAVINYLPAWIVILPGFGYFSYALLKEKGHGAENKRMASLMLIPLLFIITVVFSESTADEKMTGKLQADMAMTAEIAKESLSEKTFFGFGPENFHYAFSLYRPTGMNDAPFWYVRFNQGSSHILDLAVTTGAFGIAAYLLLCIWIIALLARKSKAQGGKNPIFMAAAAAFVSILVLQFMHPENPVLLFLFWLTAGLALSFPLEEADMARLRLPADTARYQAVTSVAALAMIGWIIAVAVGAKFAAAESFYRQSALSPDKEALLQRSISLNPYKYEYFMSLSGFYKQRFLEKISTVSDSGEFASVEEEINKGIDAAEKAVALAPNSVSAYENYGTVYRDVGAYSPDSLDFAANAYMKAIQLEPSNPVLLSETGKIYLKKGMKEKAAEYFEMAILLKEDYIDARTGLARIYLENSKNDEAINLLEGAINKNIDAYYELGRAYFNSSKYALAAENFRQVISISPLHANGLYSLGLALEKEGKLEEALAFFRKVGELNPENEDIKDKIRKAEDELE